MSGPTSECVCMSVWWHFIGQSTHSITPHVGAKSADYCRAIQSHWHSLQTQLPNSVMVRTACCALLDFPRETVAWSKLSLVSHRPSCTLRPRPLEGARVKPVMCSRTLSPSALSVWWVRVWMSLPRTHWMGIERNTPSTCCSTMDRVTMPAVQTSGSM